MYLDNKSVQINQRHCAAGLGNFFIVNFIKDNF